VIPVEGLPERVNARLAELAERLRFWVARENEQPTPAEAREDLGSLGKRSLELLLTLSELDPTPKAFIVANLPPAGLEQIKHALGMLHAAAVAGKSKVPAHRGNTVVGVPRYAAELVVDVLRSEEIPVTCSNSGSMTPAMKALAAVLEAAGYPLSPSSVYDYLHGAINSPKKAGNKQPDDAVTLAYRSGLNGGRYERNRQTKV
jgi:hypothetical protein